MMNNAANNNISPQTGFSLVNANNGNQNNNNGIGPNVAQQSMQQHQQSQVQVQQQQQQQYTIPGILHYLQYEWQRFELERQQWEVERAELQARISLLQGIDIAFRFESFCVTSQEY